MTDAPSLFDAPSKRGSLPTSAAQGHAIRETLGARRHALLQVYYEYPASLTADEAGQRLGWPPLSVRPRASELLKAGWLEDSGATRPTLGGGKGAALRISDKGATVYQVAQREADPVAAIERMYREARACLT